MAKAYIAPLLRSRVTDAARQRCGYCRTSRQVIGPLLEIDHIVPQALGGASDENNLWLACPLCNRYKSSQTEAVDPQLQEIVLLFNPRIQQWSEHFEWVEEGTIIRGITGVGRATVDALRLNIADRVAVRRLWVTAGWHPLPE